jgi:hypothetical protein
VDNKDIRNPYWRGVGVKPFATRRHFMTPPFTDTRVDDYLKLTSR